MRRISVQHVDRLALRAPPVKNRARGGKNDAGQKKRGSGQKVHFVGKKLNSLGKKIYSCGKKEKAQSGFRVTTIRVQSSRR